MPHIVEKKYPAEMLRPGQVVIFNKREHTVETIDVKVKWATMTFQELTEEYRIEKWTQMTVLVEEDTPQEAFDKILLNVAAELKKRMLSAAPSMDKHKAGLKAQIDSRYALEATHLSSYVSAQTRFNFWHRIELQLRRNDGEPRFAAIDEQKPLAEVLERADDAELCMMVEEAIETWKNMRLSQSMSHYRIDLNSAIESEQHDTMSNMVRSLRMYLNMYDRAKKILSEAP